MPKNQQKQRGFQKVIVLWNVFKSKKTGSNFPLNRFSVCVNVFCGQKCTQNFLKCTRFQDKENRRTCEDIRKIRRFVLPLDFSSVYELKNHFPIMEHRHFFYRCSPQLLIKAVQHLRNSRNGFQEVV